MSQASGRRSPREWAAHWDAKAGIEDPIELNGYCCGGVPIAAETFAAAVIRPCLELLELEPQHHVLEVGCGAGLLLHEIERRVERAVGTDFSEALIERYDGAAELHVCAAHEQPFDGEQFDRVVMNSVAHYFPEIEYFRDVVLGLVALLRRPGILLIGDVPVGPQPPDTPYLWYDRRTLANVLEPLGLPFSIAAQSRQKRAINTRYDVVVYKD
jgi:SAM-dependent methyltransferase